jgi:hypothetical protein
VRLIQGNQSFRAELVHGSEGIIARRREPSPHGLLVADLRVPSADFSTIESAYWPEGELLAVNCEGCRLDKRPRQRLELHRLDSYPHQQGFAGKSQQFVSSQAYFLKP